MPPTSSGELLERFRASPDTRFNPAEITLLEGAAETDIWAAKAVALHWFREGNLERALISARRILGQAPSDESAVNVAVCLRDLGRHAEAIEVLVAHESVVDPIRFHDLCNSAHALTGNVGEAIRHGDAALRLKDARQAGAQQSYRLNAYDVQDKRRNVIAFSVWGENPRYLNGAVNNAFVARYLYPGWTARFYTDGSTPEAFRAALRQQAAEVVMTDMPAADYGLFWRFLVEDDPDVNVYVVRDADSVMNIKERAAVARWLQSGAAFHVMRDNLQHCELMLAGMWGAHRGNIGSMRSRIETYVKGLPNKGNYRHKDQHFLREVVWPVAKESLLAHDRFFNVLNPERFDPAFDLPSYMHVGQNDWVFFRNTSTKS